MGLAFGLELADEGQSLAKLAVEACFVLGEDGELVEVMPGAFGGSERGVDPGVGVLLSLAIEADGEQVVLNGANAVEAPGAIGQGLD